MNSNGASANQLRSPNQKHSKNSSKRPTNGASIRRPAKRRVVFFYFCFIGAIDFRAFCGRMKKMSLEHKRHTLAHLLAAAIADIYRHAKPTIGPAIENGFYYDIDFGGTKISDDDLPKLEAKMRELLPKWTEFTHEVVSADGARKAFADNPYKLELIDEIEKSGEQITLYTCGGFTDLCRGGHSEHPNKDIKPDSFKLDRVEGAYWRGDEKNPMLTRIYGLAFENKTELDAYLEQREEAKKRDHRKIAKEQDLLVF